MKLSTKGKYGVRALFEIARNYGKGPSRSRRSREGSRYRCPISNRSFTGSARPASSTAFAGRTAVMDWHENRRTSRSETWCGRWRGRSLSLTASSPALPAAATRPTTVSPGWYGAGWVKRSKRRWTASPLNSCSASTPGRTGSMRPREGRWRRRERGSVDHEKGLPGPRGNHAGAPQGR